MISRRFRLAIFFCAALFLAGPPADAQTNAAPSSAEDVAIAFFKTGGVVPDFERWARGGKGFKYVAPARVKDYLSKEAQRISQRWYDYGAKETLIDIKSDVFLDLKTTIDADGNQQYWIHISFGRESNVYFPFTFQDYNIAVVPQRIETLTIHRLQQQQYELINAEFDGKGRGSAVMFLQLKPIKSYMSQPYEIDGMEQWVLLSDIATMSIRSRRSAMPYWNYGADWYTSPVTEQVLDLYKKNPGPADNEPAP